MTGIDGVSCYEYNALEHTDSFRILEILPGTQLELSFRLLHVRSSDRPSFEALSYTWGAPVFPERIFEDNTLKWIAITDSLFSCLQALRFPSRSRLLWIDAVCINQKDVSEKSVQVANMHSIYCNAERVVVWLGKESLNQSIQSITRLGNMADKYGISSIPISRDTDLANQKRIESIARLANSIKASGWDSLAKDIDSSALGCFYKSKWFTRLWTVQEFILARDIVLVAGNQDLSYDLFSKATEIIRDIVSLKPRGDSWLGSNELWYHLNTAHHHAFHLVHFREWFMAWRNKTTLVRPSVDQATPRLRLQDFDGSERPVTLSRLCFELRNKLCQDARDRIYSVLSLAPDGFSLHLDYELHPQTIYFQFALRSLQLGDLSILHYAGMIWGREPENVSWVPTWNRLNFPGTLLGSIGPPLYKAGGEKPAEIKLFHPRVRWLLTKGLRLDRVKQRCFMNVIDQQYKLVDTITEEDFVDLLETNFLGQRIPFNKHFEFVYQSWILFSSYHLWDRSFSALLRTISAGNDWLQGKVELSIQLWLFLYCLFAIDISSVLYVDRHLLLNCLQRMFSSNGGEIVSSSIEVFLEMLDEEKKHVDLTTGCEFFKVKDEFQGKMLDYSRSIWAIVVNRSIFVTEKGFLGLGPKATNAGDIVAVFDGAETPFILREVCRYPIVADGRQLQPCRLVGEGYLHGWMQGEAFNADVKLLAENFLIL